MWCLPTFWRRMGGWSGSDHMVFNTREIPVLFLFGGAFYPIDLLPDALEPVAWVTPLWHGVELTRGAVLGGLTLGAVGSATASAWSHAPIYLGPILLFVFGWPLIRRLLAVGERHHVTSIADYISARYGKRQPLAVLVTMVATAAVLPYIALQFKALAQAWTMVGGTVQEVEAIGGDTAWQHAVIETAPARAPFRAMVRSALPNISLASTRAPRPYQM